MTCKINADTSDGLKIVSDTSGEIEIQDNGTTRLTIGDTIDIQGTELVLDADADTSIHASTDDQIDFKLGGSDRIIFTSSGISTTNSSGIAIGTEDDNAAIFEISGAASGDEGGEIRLDTAADHDGTYQFYRIDVNQDDLRIGREGQTDVTIDSGGRVTKSAQPAFSGYVTGTNNYNTVGVVAINNTAINIGSHFDTSTDRFTAPVAGLYMISYGAHSEGDTNAKLLHLYKNGSVLAHGSSYAQGATHQQMGKTIVASLAANDYIQLYLAAGTVWGGDAQTGIGWDIYLLG